MMFCAGNLSDNTSYHNRLNFITCMHCGTKSFQPALTQPVTWHKFNHVNHDKQATITTSTTTTWRQRLPPWTETHTEDQWVPNDKGDPPPAKETLHQWWRPGDKPQPCQEWSPTTHGEDQEQWARTKSNGWGWQQYQMTNGNGWGPMVTLTMHRGFECWHGIVNTNRDSGSHGCANDRKLWALTWSH